MCDQAFLLATIRQHNTLRATDQNLCTDFGGKQRPVNKRYPRLTAQAWSPLSCPKFLGLSVMLHLRRGECYGQEEWIVG